MLRMIGTKGNPMDARWLVPMAIATALGTTVATMAAHAQDDPYRPRVDAPGLVFRDRAPRIDDRDRRRDEDRPAIRRDAYGRPIYFRYVPLDRHGFRNGPPYGDARDGRRGWSRTWRSDDGGDTACRRRGDNCGDRFRVPLDDD